MQAVRPSGAVPFLAVLSAIRKFRTGLGACAWVRLLTGLRVVVLIKHTLGKVPVSIVFNDL